MARGLYLSLTRKALLAFTTAYLFQACAVPAAHAPSQAIAAPTSLQTPTWTPDAHATARSLSDVRDSLTTTRISAAVAVVPIALSMLAHILLSLGHNWATWAMLQLSLIFLILAKLLAIPVGLALLAAGLVIGDLEISLVGVSTLAFIYAAQVGSWSSAYRLGQLLLWSPNLIEIQRWHLKTRDCPQTYGRVYAASMNSSDGASEPPGGIGQGAASALNDTMPDAVSSATPTSLSTSGPGGAPSMVGQMRYEPDPYCREREAFRRLVIRASEEDWTISLSWVDELVIALLATKFVCLTETELAWRRDKRRASIRELVSNLDRWKRGWTGKPGTCVKEWVRFERRGNEEETEQYETTLKLVVVLFECIRRSDKKRRREQKEELKKILNQKRGEDGMEWVYATVRRCIANTKKVNRALGLPEPPDGAGAGEGVVAQNPIGTESGRRCTGIGHHPGCCCYNDSCTLLLQPT